MMTIKKIMSWFSCGVASAVATKLAIIGAGDTPVEVHNISIKEEHPDNQRFLKECEKWFGVQIHIHQNEKYGGSIHEVYKKERFIKSSHGAACTKRLKGEVYKEFNRPGDLIVVGFTIEEKDRLDLLIDANNELVFMTPLIDRELTKRDCLAIIKRAGIEIPVMYKLGYQNNNCIGCCKGGMGYWNKIKQDFPEQFEKMATVQDLLGPGSYFFKDSNKQPISLRALKPSQGNYPKERSIQCSILCQLAEDELNDD